MIQFFFHPYLLLLFLDPGPGMGKNQDPGSGILDKHPGSATDLLRGQSPTRIRIRVGLSRWIRNENNADLGHCVLLPVQCKYFFHILGFETVGQQE